MPALAGTNAPFARGVGTAWLGRGDSHCSIADGSQRSRTCLESQFSTDGSQPDDLNAVRRNHGLMA